MVCIGICARLSMICIHFSNWHLKRYILAKVMVLSNSCINPCSEKCILGQIPIACQELCSEHIKCIPVGSSSRSLGSWNPNLRQFKLIFGIITFFKKLPILHYSFRRPQASLKVAILAKAFNTLKVSVITQVAAPSGGGKGEGGGGVFKCLGLDCLKEDEASRIEVIVMVDASASI